MRHKKSELEALENLDPRHSIELDDQFADTEEPLTKRNGSHVRYRKNFYSLNFRVPR